MPLFLSPRIIHGSGGQTDREALSVGPGKSTVNEDFGKDEPKLLGSPRGPAAFSREGSIGVMTVRSSLTDL